MLNTQLDLRSILTFHPRLRRNNVPYPDYLLASSTPGKFTAIK